MNSGLWSEFCRGAEIRDLRLLEAEINALRGRAERGDLGQDVCVEGICGPEVLLRLGEAERRYYELKEKIELCRKYGW